MDKIAALNEILSNDPQNAFARYGLAIEHAAQGQFPQSVAEFDLLLDQHPEYTAGYFMAAQTLLKAGRSPDAITRLKSGIACAQRSGDEHAAGEMQALLDDLDR